MPPAPQTFRTAAVPDTCVTSLEWVNEHSDPMLLTASNDGVVRVWKDPHRDGAPLDLRLAFHALPELMPLKEDGSGLVTCWHPEPVTLMVSGNSKYLRAWDLVAEQCVGLTNLNVPSCVSTMATVWPGGAVTYLGMGSGAVVAADARTPRGVVYSWTSKPLGGQSSASHTHAAWILRVRGGRWAGAGARASVVTLRLRTQLCIQRSGSGNTMVAGHSDGVVCMW